MDNPTTEKKGGGKTAENLLNVLGSVGGLAGHLIFGPDFNADLGAPFREGADMLRRKREEKSLVDVLRSTPQTSQLLDEGINIAQNGGVLAQLNTQPQQVDIHSPDFPAKLANAGLGDLAQKVLFAQTQKNPQSPYEDILNALQVKRALEEPSWKDKQDYDFQQALALQGMRNQDRQNSQDVKLANTEKINQQRMVNSLVEKAQKDLSPLDNSLTQTNKLLQAVDAGNFPTLATSATLSVPGGEAILQRTNPAILDTLTTIKNLKRNISIEVQSLSGAAASDKERAHIRGFNVSEFDTPEAAKKTLIDAKNRLLYGRYLVAFNRAKATGNLNDGVEVAKRLGVEPEQLRAFQLYRKLFNSGEDLTNNPQAAQLMQILGMTPQGGK